MVVLRSRRLYIEWTDPAALLARVRELYLAERILRTRGLGCSNETLQALDDCVAFIETHSWRGIATAPKDGHRVILWAPRLGLYLGNWSQLYSRWVDDRFIDRSPTHWMPLPEAPNAR